MYNDNFGISKISVPDKYRSWSILYPNYRPMNFSAPKDSFPDRLQHFVENEKGVADQELFRNPFGRTGIEGRGSLLR